VTRLLALLLLLAVAPPVRAGGVDIRVAEDGWGDAEPGNIRRLLDDVASQFVTNFPVRRFEPVFVSPGSGSPIALLGRTDRGEVRVRLATRDKFWAQYSYQFAHEFCHILCRHEVHFDPKDPNQWFEESLCEAASLFALRRMAQTWKTAAPYPNWKDFAPHLGSYAQRLLDDPARRLLPGVTLAAWHRENSDALRTNSTDRTLNGVVAAELLPLFEEDAMRWEAVEFINNAATKPEKSFAEYLSAWRDNAPRKHSAFIEKIAGRFGLEL